MQKLTYYQNVDHPFQLRCPGTFSSDISGLTLIKEALPVMDRAPAKLLLLLSYLCRWLFSCYFFYCYFFYCYFFRSSLFRSLCGHPITCPSPDRFKNLPRKDSLRLTQGSPYARFRESFKTAARVIFTRYCPDLTNWGFFILDYSYHNI